ncbi:MULTISPECIES: fimbrial protein [Pantoea]|jgi:type 1 fimbria pilin|nr:MULTISPECIES: fimbrial protein [Pantoea]MDQ1224959.1 type 1 fimbria pilin [Pantoea ananatis]MDR6092365.1 type 1 fimbria pilin [Pantoea ananatis]PVY87863.1 type 1 fimbria pilin [Pantoea ananatis]PWV66997.1 type 1 fimbria pilin [Pantoea ananatis]PWV93735.1 type 1 fimbria pilin [Pantoea ananatis]
MKIKPQTFFWMLPFILTFCASEYGFCYSLDHGHGVVGMQGSILDAPCAIEVNDRDQLIDIPALTTGEIIHDGAGFTRNFSIHLINCSLSNTNTPGGDKTHFVVTFDGIPDGKLFGVNGATGIGIEIQDKVGNIAVPGQPMPAGQLAKGRQTLNYQMRIVSDMHHMHSGKFRAVVRFKVDYY